MGDIVMPDARGHGNSAAPDHGYRYEDLAADDEVRMILWEEPRHSREQITVNYLGR